MADKQRITRAERGGVDRPGKGRDRLFMPQYGEDVEIPEDQMLLIGCAAAFKDERLVAASGCQGRNLTECLDFRYR